MKNSYKLAAAEREIMEVLWANDGKLSTGDLMDQMQERGKKWKRQTLNTLLTRLEEKDVISRPRAYVEAKMTEKDLQQLQAKEILDHFYGGKLNNFCAALVGNARIDEEEAARLNALIDELVEKKRG
ncbi:MAG: BlaI/MecI/CopY family transcriptional regulator [Acetatifactor sp.]|nr:BlaI/MecI/CopY family transcriptional regulator [Acetatifactor sp.]